jgi:DNA-binding XRE family transcriptional regulator
MTKVSFLDGSTIEVTASDGEKITLKSHLPVRQADQKPIAQALSKSFTKNFSDDKSGMVYWVLMNMLGDYGFGFAYESSDRSEERIRIGARIREMRESKGMEAKQLAMLADIDAANLCRIEQGRYSVGLDILVKLSQALGLKVDLV